MIVTNAAAAVARNTEIDTKSSTLDFGPELHRSSEKKRGFSVKDIVSPSSFPGWLESSASEGERWLRSAAQDGDLYAMEKPGLRLLSGCCLPKLRPDRQTSLKESTELGNPFAVERLAANDIIRSFYMTSCS